MTLAELKADMRDQIRETKACIRDLRYEHEGVDRCSGHYGKTGKFDMKRDLMAQLEVYEYFLERLKKVKKLK